MDFDPGAVRHHAPDLVHLPVCKGDTALRPVEARMSDVLGAPVEKKVTIEMEGDKLVAKE